MEKFIRRETKERRRMKKKTLRELKNSGVAMGKRTGEEPFFLAKALASS